VFRIAGRSAVAFALALLLAWSFALRVWLAMPEPTSNRYWDERYGAQNIRSLLGNGELRPANGYHPGLSYLPHAALLAGSELLHDLTGRSVFQVLDGQGRLGPTGYRLCRVLQALAGALSLFLTFRIGRRLFSPAVGLTAALFLAVVPWHIRQSVIFKPDIILLAMSLLAFDRSLEVAERPTLRSFLLAGGAIGLALASKFNAGPVAIPLAVAALAYGGWRDRRQWGRLGLAAGAAALVFLVFTPFAVLDPDLYLHDFSLTLQDYAKKGNRLGSSHAEVLVQGLRALLSESFHGVWIGALGLLGLGALAFVAWRKRKLGHSRAERLGPLLIVAYPLGYALLYCLSTTNPSDHNWLPLTPFIALSAAWVLLRCWAWLVERAPFQWSRAAGAVAVVAMTALLVTRASASTYEEAVPSTEELARKVLEDRLQPLDDRVVVCVGAESSGMGLERSRVVAEEIENFGEISPAELDRADAEVFAAAGEKGLAARPATAMLPDEVAKLTAFPFRARGTALVVVLHPWSQVGEPVEIELTPSDVAPERLIGRLPRSLRPGEIVSLTALAPLRNGPETVRELRVGGQRMTVVASGREAGRWRLASGRFPVGEPGVRIDLFLTDDATGSDVLLRMRRWRR